jgi:hypothetical protein
VQGVPIDAADWIPHVMHLWMQLPADEPPAGLFIADDNLLKAVSHELAANEYGKKLPIVAHSNFPLASRRTASMGSDTTSTPCSTPGCRQATKMRRSQPLSTSFS